MTSCPNGNCLAGKSNSIPQFAESSTSVKNILVLTLPKSNLQPAPSRPNEGRLAIVTNAGRDAVDADVLLTNSTKADGEVVWS